MILMTRSEAQAAIQKYGGQRRAADALGITRKKIELALRRDDVPGGKASARAAVVKAATQIKCRTLDEFRQTYDKATIVPAKIKAGLKTLGATGWEYEVQFAKLCGISSADLSAYRDGFASHVVPLRDSRRAWAGTVSTANKMKEML